MVTTAAQPFISAYTAWLGSLLMPVLYVAPFYVSKTLSTTDASSRDDPRIIQARIRTVVATCAICSVVSSILLLYGGNLTSLELLHWFGIYPINPMDIVRVTLLVAVLFAGPLYEAIAVDHQYEIWSWSYFRNSIWSSWTGYRNLVVAPISEEWVFRSLTVALFLAAKRSTTEIVFGSPLVFGVAHLHHLVDFLRSHTPRGHSTPPLRIWMIGIVRSLVQFSYTSLFGFFATFVYLRTGNVCACIAAHIFCNWQGVPRVWGRVGVAETTASSQPLTDVTPNVVQSNVTPSALRDLSQVDIRPSHGVVWTILYYLLLVAGAYGFALTLWPLTQSRNTLVEVW